jgi:hypothetical protein
MYPLLPGTHTLPDFSFLRSKITRAWFTACIATTVMPRPSPDTCSPMLKTKQALLPWVPLPVHLDTHHTHLPPPSPLPPPLFSCGSLSLPSFLTLCPSLFLSLFLVSTSLMISILLTLPLPLSPSRNPHRMFLNPDPSCSRFPLAIVALPRLDCYPSPLPGLVAPHPSSPLPSSTRSSFT